MTKLDKYDDDIQSRKVFVGGLSDTTNDKSFAEYFMKFGDLCDSKVMFDKNTGRPKRFGFLVYAEVSSLQNCLKNSPHTLDGNELTVKKSSQPTEVKTSRDKSANCEIHVLFPFGSKMDEQMISMYFSQFGKVVSCVIPVNKILNRPKNFCFIKFAERDCVLRALDKKQHMMGKQIIMVTEFNANKQGSTSKGGRKPQSSHDDSYGNWCDDEPSQSSGRGDYRSHGPPKYIVKDGYEYELVRKVPDSDDYRQDRRSRDYDGYSNRRSPPPMMRGPMRNRGGPRDRFNPMGRPQRGGRKSGAPAGYGYKPLQENKVFVGGLSMETHNESLYNYFSQFGEVFDHIVMAHPNGHPKGFGYVTFANNEALTACLNAGEHHLDGAKVNVQKGKVHKS